MLKAFLFEVWNTESITKEVLVIAISEEKALDRLSCIISGDEDYELQEELDYNNILI